MIPKFIERLHRDLPPLIYGDGGQSRDFVFVQDVVQANIKACGQEGIAGEVFNVASGRSYTLLQLFDHLKGIIKSAQAPQFAPVRPGDIRHSRASIRKAGKILGFRPEFGLRQGLKTTVEYMQRQRA